MAQTEEVTTTVSQTETPVKIIRTAKTVSPPPIKTEPPQERYETKKVIFRTYQVIMYITGVIETLLAFRIILKALGANPDSGFVQFMYALSDPFALPFAGMFRTITEGNSVFELSSFIACLVYLVIAYAIIQLFQLIKPTSPQEVEENV